MDDYTALEAFRGEDNQDAERALEYLRNKSESYLHRCLLSLSQKLSRDDRRDIIQDTYLKVWGKRAEFQNRGIAAWFAFLKTTASRIALDKFRSCSRFSEVSLNDDIQTPREDEYESLNTIIESLLNAHQSGQFLRCANVLWLGLDVTLPSEIHTRQLLAAQHFYLHGRSPEEIIRLLPPLSPEEPALTRPMLDSWLEHPGVLRLLAYQELYYPNDRLCCHLLGWGEACGPAHLEALTHQIFDAWREEEAPMSQQMMEAALILWRYRDVSLLEEMLDHKNCHETEKKIEAILVSLGERLPFGKKMTQLLSCLCLIPLEKLQATLGGRQLWQRLAFQYRYLDCLPHSAIQERTQPASQQVGYDVTLATLNGWLSGRRLLDQLAKFYVKAEEEANNG